MKNLTATQTKILAFIREYFAENGTSPTLEQIAAKLGYTSRAGVHYQIDMLEKAGEIVRSNDSSRSIKLRTGIQLTRIPVTKIPIYGIAKAGKPYSEAEDMNNGFIEVDANRIQNKGNLFAVRISGDSMDKASIGSDSTMLKDGNYAVIDESALNIEGKIVLALINGCATIKIFNKRVDSVVLSPYSTNETHHPIYVNDGNELIVRGKVVMALENPVIKPDFE